MVLRFRDFRWGGIVVWSELRGLWMPILGDFGRGLRELECLYMKAGVGECFIRMLYRSSSIGLSDFPDLSFLIVSST